MDLRIAAGGYAYLIDTREPARWEQVEYRPVTEIRALAEQDLLLFSSFHSLLAWGREGKAWQTGRLSWDGVRITEVRGATLFGLGWEMRTDRELEFEVNLKTGEHRGGGYLAVEAQTRVALLQHAVALAVGRSFPPAAVAFCGRVRRPRYRRVSAGNPHAGQCW